MATKTKYGKPIRRVQVFTVSQVARLEGVSERRVRQRIATGELKAYKKRGRWWVEEWNAYEDLAIPKRGVGRRLDPAAVGPDLDFTDRPLHHRELLRVAISFRSAVSPHVEDRRRGLHRIAELCESRGSGDSPISRSTHLRVRERPISGFETDQSPVSARERVR